MTTSRATGVSAAAALLVLLVHAAWTQPAAAAPFTPLNPLCTSVRSSWANSFRCGNYLNQLEIGVATMSSYVKAEYLTYTGDRAKAPDYAATAVLAVWEGTYTATGYNPVVEMEPLFLNAVVDGIVPCSANGLAPTALVTFKQLGLNGTLIPSANLQGSEAMCSVTPMLQTESPASVRLAQLWAYIFVEKTSTADNSGLYLGCQDYNNASMKFDGIVSISCNFIAPLSSSSSGGGAQKQPAPGGGSGAGGGVGATSPLEARAERVGLLEAVGDGRAVVVGGLGDSSQQRGPGAQSIMRNPAVAEALKAAGSRSA